MTRATSTTANSTILPSGTECETVTTSSTVPQLEPFTLGGPTSTFAKTTLTFSRNAPVTSTGFVKSPLDDPNVGWIHELLKKDLQIEMAKHGLDIDGTSEQLRKRFVTYWKQARDRMKVALQGETRLMWHNVTQSLRTTLPTQREYLELSGAGVDNSEPPLSQEVLRNHFLEMESIREILQLSPRADFNSLKRTLIDLVEKSRRLSPVVPTSTIGVNRPGSDKVPELDENSRDLSRPCWPIHWHENSQAAPGFNLDRRCELAENSGGSAPQLRSSQASTLPQSSYYVPPKAQGNVSYPPSDVVGPSTIIGPGLYYLPELRENSRPKALGPKYSKEPGTLRRDVLHRTFELPGNSRHSSRSTHPVSRYYFDRPVTQVDDKAQTATGTLPPFDYAGPSLDYPEHSSSHGRRWHRNPEATEAEMGVANICNLVRKWNLRFDGNKASISFLERLDELIEAHALAPNDVVKAMPELLHGSALLWFRNLKSDIHSYREFREKFGQQFLPSGYQMNLNAEIQGRTQGESESFRDYVTAIMTLMRRSGNFSEHQKLEQIYENIYPEYRTMIRRHDFTSLSELTARAEEYEAYVRARQTYRPPPPPSQALVKETAYVRNKNPCRANVAAIEDPLQEKGNEQPPLGRGRYSSRPYLDHPPSPRNQRRPQANEPQNFRRDLEEQNPYLKGNRESKPMCWNCECEGHFFCDCPEPKTLRCFRCKREGISTVKCPCESGNGQRTQPHGGSLSPAANSNVPPPTSGSSGSPM